jgi:hypothetical protein
VVAPSGERAPGGSAIHAPVRGDVRAERAERGTNVARSGRARRDSSFRALRRGRRAIHERAATPSLDRRRPTRPLRRRRSGTVAPLARQTALLRERGVVDVLPPRVHASKPLDTRPCGDSGAPFGRREARANRVGIPRFPRGDDRGQGARCGGASNAPQGEPRSVDERARTDRSLVSRPWLSRARRLSPRVRGRRARGRIARNGARGRRSAPGGALGGKRARDVTGSLRTEPGRLRTAA